MCFKGAHKTDALENFSEEEGPGTDFRFRSDNDRGNPTKKSCENVQKKLFWQMQKIYVPAKEFHIIFLRMFFHAFSLFHQKKVGL